MNRGNLWGQSAILEDDPKMKMDKTSLVTKFADIVGNKHRLYHIIIFNIKLYSL